MNRISIYEGKTILSLLSLNTGKNNEREVVHVRDCLIHVPWLSQGWLMSVFCSNTCNYIFVCFFIHHEKSSFTPVFRVCQFKCCSMSPTLNDCIAVCWWQTLQHCFGPFRVDRFRLYCRGLRENNHTQMMVSLDIYRLLPLRRSNWC